MQLSNVRNEFNNKKKSAMASLPLDTAHFVKPHSHNVHDHDSFIGLETWLFKNIVDKRPF